MRPAPLLRLLLVPVAVLAIACDGESPAEPTPLTTNAPATETPALATERWADGYLLVGGPFTSTYFPDSRVSYNRTGADIKVTRPAGTTGRFIATFPGLSAALATQSTVHVTGYGADETYCKPVGAKLASDKLEVRCYRMGTGAAVNAGFSLVILRKRAGRAFAFAHQPTTASYAPSAGGSWNPAGSINVRRTAQGQYDVTFARLGSATTTNGGQVQVNAVGTGKAHCKPAYLTEAADVLVTVRCFSATGALVDSKFTVLFQLPAAHLAYTLANQPTTRSYYPDPFWSSNPSGGSTEVFRVGVGVYEVQWPGVAAEIFDRGNVQVTAYGPSDTHCKIEYYMGSFESVSGARVRCFGPNLEDPAQDSEFSIMVGS
jgi:hypothetical protein